ncbi:hypothetical protein [Natranaeroarchaeum sulfidigenes]|uniref:Uncharacterized protein n=1 Tax=Natranaeroarchaeum sulfidigenes TaxID=2784880 RepID=A0A897MQ17_9EURY|nr:hypothetical protein [Natranaeroarchaeum sulfidigenes]QSG02522.1 hypothetical protein AArcS_1305 [Natranaeroarchaeum sulfidigenes]
MAASSHLASTYVRFLDALAAPLKPQALSLVWQLFRLIDWVSDDDDIAAVRTDDGPRLLYQDDPERTERDIGHAEAYVSLLPVFAAVVGVIWTPLLVSVLGLPAIVEAAVLIVFALLALSALSVALEDRIFIEVVDE